MKDTNGNTIQIGDVVRVAFIDAGRGAIHGITSSPATVVAFGRTRVTLDVSSRVGFDKVGAECLAVTKAVDGRTLITANEAWEARMADFAAKESGKPFAMVQRKA